MVLLYGSFIAQAALAVVGIAIPFVALYLFCQLVRAHDRTADALGRALSVPPLVTADQGIRS